MRDDPIWVIAETVLVIQEELIREHGGSLGVRDPGLLHSALNRPRHLFAYGEPDLFDMAASYAFGIANNHPFVDGNKRAAFMAAAIFLEDNGIKLIASEAAAADATLGLADKTISEEAYAQFLRDNSHAKSE